MTFQTIYDLMIARDVFDNDSGFTYEDVIITYNTCALTFVVADEEDAVATIPFLIQDMKRHDVCDMSFSIDGTILTPNCY